MIAQTTSIYVNKYLMMISNFKLIVLVLFESQKTRNFYVFNIVNKPLILSLSIIDNVNLIYLLN